MNNKGLSTIIVIILTALVTLALTFIAIRAYEYMKVLENGVEPSIVETSSGDVTYTPEKTYSSIIPAQMQFKMMMLKTIIDENYIYEYDEKEMTDLVATAMMQSINDPYAEYYNEQAFESFYTQNEGEYFGIGIYVAYDQSRNMPIIILPLENSPAEEVGLKTADYIEYVDDLKSKEHSYTELIDSIKGLPGTKVKIGIIRQKDDNSKEVERLEFEVERRRVEINPIKTNIYENSIGYIKMTAFDEAAYEKFKTEYENMENNPKIKSLIIDLRDNLGGVLTVCAKITDLVVPEGKIMYSVNKKGEEDVVSSDERAVKMPLVVLVNGNSASASEVFAAAVKDYKVGTIIGKKTYGKGVVQKLIPVRDGTYVKLTTSEYFSPLGNKINGIGVEPDIEVDLPDDIKNAYKLDFEKDTQLQKAIEVLKNK